MNVRFTHKQKLLLTILVALYSSAYFCRLNLSAALDGIITAMDLPIVKAGFLQTVFALTYATGQLINGAIVDRVNPARYMLVGIAGSAVCNLAMGTASAYPAMLFIWAVNAAFQSMLWTPVMRLIAMHFSGEGERQRANAMLALALTFGHLGAWAISGFLSTLVSWRFSFIVPACLALIAFAASARALRALDAGTPKASAAKAQAAAPAQPIHRVFTGTGFYFVLAGCVLYGFIRDGAVTWTPTLLARAGSSALSATAFTLILPLLNSVGVVIGFTLRSRGSNPHIVVVLMMLCAIVCGGVLLTGGSVLLIAILLGLICAAMYGANTMLTGLIPLEYDRVGKTGLTAGLIDSLIYAGSALAGALGGGLYEHMGSGALYASWIAAAVFAALLMRVSARRSTRYWKAEDDAQ